MRFQVDTEDTFNTCLENVKKCDRFILILKERYGIPYETGEKYQDGSYKYSITEEEFMTAYRNKKPILTFIYRDTFIQAAMYHKLKSKDKDCLKKDLRSYGYKAQIGLYEFIERLEHLENEGERDIRWIETFIYGNDIFEQIKFKWLPDIFLYQNKILDSIYIEDINLSLINPENFENLIYYLLEEMGMKNIAWDKGGVGTSAFESGRILNCEKYNFPKDGSVYIENWCIIVRHSPTYLGNLKLEENLPNLTAFQNKNVIGIVTNDIISPNTKDWIKKAEKKYPDKKIIKWDRDNLVELIIKHPNLVYRFFPSSLTLTGRFNSIEPRFFSYLHLPSVSDLIEIWKNKDDLSFSPKNILPIILAENIYGDIFRRQWGLWLEKDLLLNTLNLVLLNIYNLIEKCKQFGKEQDFLMYGIEYLILSNLLKFQVESLVENIIAIYTEKINNFDKEKIYQMINCIFKPRINNIILNFIKNCSESTEISCKKLSWRGVLQSYVKKFIPYEIFELDNYPTLIIKTEHHRCEVGIASSEECCPLEDKYENFEISNKSTFIEILKIIKKALINIKDTTFRSG